MKKDWQEFAEDNFATFKSLSKSNPELARTINQMAVLGGQRILEAKTRELISLAVAVTTRCEGCIVVHTQAAIKAGASRAEIEETLAVAIALNAGAAAVYSSKVLEAYDQLAK